MGKEAIEVCLFEIYDPWNLFACYHFSVLTSGELVDIETSFEPEFVQCVLLPLHSLC